MYNFFVDKSTENIYISTPIVYNNKDIVGEYTKCGMALPLCNELMDYLEMHQDLYAACTHTDFRKKGLMSGLINYAIAYCKDQGYSSIFLVPANPELYSYYAKFGFIPSFRKKVLRIKNSEENTNTNYCTTDIEKILKLKRRLQN